jgi:hypothetical protein
MFLPCMCGLVKFEDEAALRKSTRSYERHGEFVRDVLKAKIARTGAPVDGDMLVRFLKTLQIGLGLTLLEGKRTEARAAVRFFLDLMKRTMEAT